MAELGPTQVRRPGLWGHGGITGYPLTGDVSSPFGPRTPFWTTSGWTTDFHSGIDIPAMKGTPLFAPCDFIVTFSGNRVDRTLDSAGGQGMFGQLSDGSGIGFWHMEGLQLDIGHRVRRGDIIGQVGTSGMSTGDHLHFMRLRGPMANGISWYHKDLFFDPMPEFTAAIASDSIVIEPIQEQPSALVDFIESSLIALRSNPPTDMTAALLELQRRVAYLRGLLGL